VGIGARQEKLDGDAGLPVRLSRGRGMKLYALGDLHLGYRANREATARTARRFPRGAPTSRTG